MTRVRWGVSVAALLVAVSCIATPDAMATTGPDVVRPYPPYSVAAPGGEWHTTAIDDEWGSLLGFAELGGAPLALFTSGQRIRILDVRAGGSFEAPGGSVKVTDLDVKGWGPIAWTDDRLVVTLWVREGGQRTGTRQLLFLDTTDGATFHTQSFPRASIADIATDGTRWAAIGRHYDAATGTQVNTLWLSTDGTAWVESSIGPVADGMRLMSLALGNGRIVVLANATGRSGERYALVSTDGAEWTRSSLQVPWDASLVFVDGRFEAGVGRTTRRSADGVSWVKVVDETAPPNVAIWGESIQDLDVQQRRWFEAQVVASAPSGVVVVGGGTTLRTDLLHCYDDADTCRQRHNAIWMRQNGAWRRLEVTIPGGVAGDGEAGSTVEQATRVGGTIVVEARSTVQRWHYPATHWFWVWAPDDGVSPPATAEPFDTGEPVSDYRLAPSSPADLEIGVEYAIPLLRGCHRTSYLGTFAGVDWVTDELGPPGTWPTAWLNTTEHRGAEIYGVAVRTSADRVEYRLPEVGTIATFRPGIVPWEMCRVANFPWRTLS